MASSRAIKKKRDDTALTNYQPMPERAPSVERVEPPTIARIVAMIGLFLTVLGALAMLAPRIGRVSGIITPDWGYRIGSVGILLLLYHAFIERDLQFRRLYGFLGLALVVGGVALRVLAFRAGYMTTFAYYGLPCLAMGLIVVLAVIRNETEPSFRNLLLNTIGVVGGVMILFAAVMGLRRAEFLPGEGIVLLVLGIFYVSSYIGQQETGSERAHYASLGLGGFGVVGFLVGVLCSSVPDGYFLSPYNNFFIPSGLILISVSIICMAISLGISCDWPVIVLTRRDLAAYFYSPIAYLIFFGMIVVGGFMFMFFVDQLISDPADFRRGGGIREPIVGQYIFSIWVVIMQMFIIAALTMRLFSEEKRTGTLEVLLTAPVNEISIVVGKFLACWIFYLFTWLPWWLFLVALRYMGNEEFDYRPVLSFMAALAAASAGLLAMGMFFSSMTSNQIIAAVLTFVGTLSHLVFYFVRHQFTPEGTALHEVFRFANFLDLWLSALDGALAPRYLIFHVSVAVFFLFATVKMLESRKWS